MVCRESQDDNAWLEERVATCDEILAAWPNRPYLVAWLDTNAFGLVFARGGCLCQAFRAERTLCRQPAWQRGSG